MPEKGYGDDKMKILSLKDAEKLKVVIHPGDSWTIWECRAKYLVEIRELYGKGFAICVPEDVLWDDFKERTKDLGVE